MMRRVCGLLLAFVVPMYAGASTVVYFQTPGSGAASMCGSERQAKSGGAYVACNSTTQRCELTGVTGGCIGWYDNFANCGSAGIHLYCTVAECPDGTEPDPVTGECQAACPESGSPPHANMHWDSSACEWRFDGCSTEAPLTNTPGVYLGGTMCEGGCVYNPYTYAYTANPAPGAYSTDWRQTGFQCTGSESASPLTCDPNSWATPVGCAPLQCPANQHRDENGACVWDDCPAQQHRDENGACVWDACPAGQSRNPEGNCVADGNPSCASGQHWSTALQKCVADDPLTPPAPPSTPPVSDPPPATPPDGTGTSTGGDGTWAGYDSTGMGGASGAVVPRGLELPAMPEVTSYAEATEQFLARVEGSPIGQGITGMGAGFPEGGNCPFGSLDLGAMGWGSISMAWVCDIWESVGAVVSTAALALYVILGIIIIASA